MNNGNSLSRRMFLPIAVALLIASCGGGGGNGGSGNNSPTANIWLIPVNEVVDGGPGKDGIPSIDRPLFESVNSISSVADEDFVTVVRHEGGIKAYPVDILTWHEVVNDGPDNSPYTMSYCPLTGSAVAWHGNANHARKRFGVSGLLYNSNLILYDRETDSNWSQMLQLSVNGPRAGERPARMQVIETRLDTLREMYPNAQVMTRETSYTRDYDDSPYGPHYLINEIVLFPLAHEDNRLHYKTRAIGIYTETSSKVYQVDSFGASTQTINEQFENQSIVVVGNSTQNIAAIYNRELSDGTILTFSPIQDDLPNIMSDGEGNIWDVFGTAVSGPRVGEQLEMTQSYTAFWFAWVAFFENPQIHFN